MHQGGKKTVLFYLQMPDNCAEQSSHRIIILWRDLFRWMPATTYGWQLGCCFSVWSKYGDHENVMIQSGQIEYDCGAGWQAAGTRMMQT